MPRTQDSRADAAAEDEAAEEAAEGLRTTVERTGPCECVLRIEADADYLRERYQKELGELQSEVKLPGFRRGKAPLGLVERRMGQALRGDLIASVVGEAYDEALHEHELTVVAEAEAPDLEEVAWEPGQPAEFTFRLEVLPEIELSEGDYKGLRIEVPALEPTPELMEQELKRFAQQFASWEQVEGAGIDWDDYVEAEVSVPEADWTETIGFYPRAERIGPFAVEGIKAVLVGAEVGDEIEIEGELAEGEAGRHEELAGLAGRKVELKLTIEQAARRKVPEVDDVLASKIGLSSVDEIQQMVRERLERGLQERKDEIAREMVLDRLLERAPVELPPALVERAAEREQTRRLVRMLRLGVPRQEAERVAVEQAGRTREAVARGLRGQYLMQQIAEKERILVTESEVDSQIRGFASRQGWREERARSYMEERGMVRALREDMRESKTMDFLIENAAVEEIAPEEFQRRHGAEQEAQ